MSEYKQHIGNDTFYTMREMWMLVTQCPFIEKLEHLFDIKDETMMSTYTQGGEQFNLDGSKFIPEQQLIIQWLTDKFAELRLPFKINCINQAWCVSYNKGGFQAMHRHNYDVLNPTGGDFSCVINFDDVPLLDDCEVNGCLYTMMPTPSGYQYYEEHPSKRGQATIMHADVWHGVYPTQHPRRCLVLDMNYTYDENMYEPNNKQV